MKPIIIENLNQIKSDTCREQVQERIANYAHDIIVRDSCGYVSVFSDMPDETGRGQWVASVCDYIPTWKIRLASFCEKLFLTGGIEIQQKLTQNSWCECPYDEWDPAVDTEYYYLCVWVEKTERRYPCPFFTGYDENWEWWKIMPFMILHPFLFFRIRKECKKYYEKREKYLIKINYNGKGEK
jgi:hypothetical protein